jgi:hypothetical protein
LIAAGSQSAVQSEGSADAFRIGSERRRFFHFPGMTAQRHTLPARNQVEVEMENRLSGCRSVELLDQQAFRVHPGLDGAGDLLDGLHIRPPAVFRHVEKVHRILFRDHQCVSLGLRHYIHESQRVLVLVDLVARNFSAQNFRENIVRAVGVFVRHRGGLQVGSGVSD